MRAKYAKAIRFGIECGKRTRYGDLDDPTSDILHRNLNRFYGDSE